jgi:hypothetical protein
MNLDSVPSQAEMAKKNLHTKRGLSNELGGPGSATGGPSFPLSALDSATLARLANAGSLNPAVLAELARQSAAAAQSQSQQGQQQGPPPAGPLPSSSASSLDRERDSRQFDALHSVAGANSGSTQGPREGMMVGPPSTREYYDDSSTTSPPLQQGAFYGARRTYSRERPTSSAPEYPHDAPHSPTSSSSAATSSPHLRSSIVQSAYPGKSMLQQLDEGVEDLQRSLSLPSLRQHAGSSMYNDRPQTQIQTAYPPLQQPYTNLVAEGYQDDERDRPGFNTHSSYGPPSQSQSAMYPSRIGVGGGGGYGSGLYGGPTSPPLGSNGIPRTQNPADMNAPKK